MGHNNFVGVFYEHFFLFFQFSYFHFFYYYYYYYYFIFVIFTFFDWQRWATIHMSKLDVFLWLTVKCYSEVSRSSHRRCSIRTPFLQNTSRWLLLSFHKKILTNVKNGRQKKVQKRFIYGEKKGKYGTEGNELKCQLL